jgi:hypothetical protein
MAGDWIKVEKVTADKPEIAILARKLGVSHGEAFLNWFRVYSWADGVTSDGRVPFLSLDDGDTLSRAQPGTCAALASDEIGWLLLVDGSMQFGKWDRHNGKSAKGRALESEKKRAQRARRPADVPQSVPQSSGQNQGPEKRREEKSKDLPNGKSKRIEVSDISLPPRLETKAVREAVSEWLDYKRSRGESYKQASHLSRRMAQFASAEFAIASIHSSMGSNYSGLVDAKGAVNTNRPGVNHDPTATAETTGDPTFGKL